VPRAAKLFFIPVVHSPPGAVGQVAASELPSQEGRARSRGTRGSTGAHLSKEARFGAAGHVVAPEPTSVGRCGLKVQLTWQRVDARPAPCPDLELVCGGTWSSGYRLRPSGPPRERLRTHRWGLLFGAPLGYLELFTWQSTTAPQEVPELKVRERPTSTIRNVDGGPPGGAGCAARIRQLKLGYALDTYPIWIRIGYAVDTYPKSIRKK
jgi:hypothetical protein